MKYINRDDAMRIVLRQTGQAAVAAIQDLPAIDAVPVVRCRECKHLEAFKNGVNGWCNQHGVPQSSFWYCADGERGEWEERYIADANPLFRRRFYCSRCGEWTTHGKTRYCPNCGAKMKGDNDADS